MENFITSLFQWVADNESALSGLVAIAVLVGLITSGFRRLASTRRAVEQETPETNTTPSTVTAAADQDIQYCRTSDGKRIAYAVTGEGPPIVRCMGWFTHLETEWHSPIGRGFWERLSRNHQLVRYDGRGMGLSEATTEFTAESRLADLEAVVEAAGLDHFALIAVSEGARTAIRYAIRHPEKVTHLVLYGCAIYPNTAKNEQVKENYFANHAMIKTGWGKETHRRFFADLFLGLNASPEERDYFAEIQRRSTPPEVALAYFESLGERDQAFEVAHQVSVPTLILHPEEDRMVDFSCSVQLAAEIPGARFKPLSGDCHYLMLNTERSQAEEYISAIESFMPVSDSTETAAESQSV